MARPVRKRNIDNPPPMEGFKPFGVPMKDLEPVVLLYEEYEAIRLADYDGLTQENASHKMGISRPTFTRIYEKARRTVAQAFVEGKAIIIEGGNFQTDDLWYRCESCFRVIISKSESESCIYCKSGPLRKLNRKI